MLLENAPLHKATHNGTRTVLLNARSAAISATPTRPRSFTNAAIASFLSVAINCPVVAARLLSIVNQQSLASQDELTGIYLRRSRDELQCGACRENEGDQGFQLVNAAYRSTKRKERELSHLEKLQAKRYADDGGAPKSAGQHIGDGFPYPNEDHPDDVRQE